MQRNKVRYPAVGFTKTDEAVSRLPKSERLELLETRQLMRRAFYADLSRQPPTDISHMPSYVRAVRKKWGLLYNNSARQLLAEIEGFPTWEAMMSAE